jgi:hypothetical protein
LEVFGLVSVKREQGMAVLYSAMGVVAGLISQSFWGKDALIALAMPLVVYAVVTVPLMRILSEKRKGLIFSNTFMTFMLVWATVWVLLFNLYPPA